MRPQEILQGLTTKTFGRNCLCLDKTNSTNDVALHLAQEGASEGTLVTAETQTRGRGRQGREWSSAAGRSLAFSILLWPKLQAEELPEITLAAAVAVARTLEAHHFKPEIKWPNDLLLRGRKVCGILTESGPRKGKMIPVILGVGINVNLRRGDFPQTLRGLATSLYLEKRRKLDRAGLLRDLLTNLEETYQWVIDRKFQKVLTQWKMRSVTLGRQVRVTQGPKRFYGQALDLDEKGALLLRNDLGMIERVTSGDVEGMVLKKRKGKP